MRKRMESPPETGLGGPTPDPGRGNTLTEQGETQHAVPRTPNERDESADAQAAMEPSNRRMGKAGQADMERGLTDTSKGAELDQTYDKLREDLPDGEKKFRP